MKILVVSSKYPKEYAGSGLRAHNTYKRLEKKYNIKWQVLCNSTEFAGNSDYEFENVKVKRISSKLFNKFNNIKNPLFRKIGYFFKSWQEALQSFFYFAKNDFDVIHVFGISSSTSAAIIWAKIKNIPLVIELVNSGALPTQNLPLLSLFYKPNVKTKTVIVAISRALREACEKIDIKENVWQRPNPVDEKRYFLDFNNKEKYKKEILGSGYENKKIISTVAKFMPRKNQIFLIEVIKNLPDDFFLVLAGPKVKKGSLINRDEKYLDDIIEKIKKENLEDKVLVRAQFVEPEKYMKASDVYLMPHYGEGLGTPMLEAVSCGTPVVANLAEKAFQEWIIQNENGFLCSTDDANSWAEAIIKASEFSQEKKHIQAEKISKLSSTNVIDEKYFEILTTLKDWEYIEPINIAKIVDYA